MAIPVMGHIGSAQAAGVITPARRQQIEAVTRPVTARDLGIDPDMIETDRATLATYFVDDSGSMRDWIEAVIASYNRGLKFIADAPSRNEILVGTMALSGDILYAYERRQKAKGLNREIYIPTFGETPLHRQTAQLCRLITEKQGQLAGKGIPTRTMTLVMSDGQDTDENKYLEAAQAGIQQLQSGYKSKVYGIGFGDYARAALIEMGIPSGLVLPAGNEKQLTEAFLEFSQATSAA